MITSDALETIFRRDIIGGLLPGILFLAEIYMFISLLRMESLDIILANWINFLDSVSLLSAIGLLLFLLPTGWVCGWMVRKAGFRIMAIGPLRKFSIGRSGQTQNMTETLAEMEEFDTATFADLASKYYWWPQILGAPLSAVEESYLFHRVKQWLRNKDPNNAALDKEATINALAGFMPVALGAAIILFSTSPWFALVAICIFFIILDLAIRETRHEEADLLRNFANYSLYDDVIPHAENYVPWPLFEKFFRRNYAVRVDLDWELSRGLPVRLELYGSIPKYWYTAWYVAPTEQGHTVPVDHHHPSARPLTVEESSQLMMNIDPAREVAIQKMAEAMSRGELKDSCIAVWRTPSGDTTIIDGNHRAVASVRCSNSNTLAVFVVYGPASPRLLPDLRHHG